MLTNNLAWNFAWMMNKWWIFVARSIFWNSFLHVGHHLTLNNFSFHHIKEFWQGVLYHFVFILYIHASLFVSKCIFPICLGIEIWAPMNMNRLQNQHQPEKHEDYMLLNIIQCRIIDLVTSIYVNATTCHSRKFFYFFINSMFVSYGEDYYSFWWL